MFFTTAVLFLSSYVSSSTASTSVEQFGITYGDSMTDMVVTFASFHSLDENAQCIYGVAANDLRYFL
jgi:hypothetical protein